MALPSPNLDDRRFQQLVDEAKRYVQQRSPEWTDHNVSDPGVTLIETFAYMVDQLLYRLNRVPDKNYSAFLDLLGVTLFPPSVARAEVDFWLSAPQPETVLLPAGTEVATSRGEAEEAVVFSTSDDLPIVPSSLVRLVTAPVSGDQTDRTAPLGAGKDIPCFQPRPEPGDALLFGLPTAVPRCIVAVRLDSRVEGVGVDPRQPPLVWEAWDGARWVTCQTGTDSTGGLNRPGEVIVFVPAGHTASVTAGTRAGWLRCRVTAPEPGQPFYSESPTIREAEVFTVGGTTGVEHAETVLDVPLGISEGVAGQRFSVSRAPLLLDGEPPVVQVSSAEGWQVWTAVEHFGASSPDDRHVRIDAVSGEFTFPPEVREPDGTMRAYGAVPEKGAQLRVPRYLTGGGAAGNVARGAICVLRSSVPYVAGVENREAARGGVDGETVENAKVRAPNILRVQERAVTAEDYEVIAREAAPSLRRVRCLPAVAGEGGAVRVLVVPDAVADEDGQLRFERWSRRTPCSRRSRRGSTNGGWSAPDWWWNRPRTRASPWSRGWWRPVVTWTGSARRRSRHCSATSTRCGAERRGPDGPSAGRCSTARSSPCSRACGGGPGGGSTAVPRGPDHRPARSCGGSDRRRPGRPGLLASAPGRGHRERGR